MTSGCPELKPLTQRAFDQKDTEGAWASDINLYHSCRLKYYALRNYYKKRDAALRSSK